LKSALSIPSLELHFILVAPRQSTERTSDVFFHAIVAIEKLLIQRNSRHHDHLRRFDARTLLPASALHRGSIDLRATVKTLDLDLLIAFEGGADISDVADVPRLGAISLEHLGDHISQDSPIGFWNVYFREDTTEFSIRHFSGSSDANEILRGRIG